MIIFLICLLFILIAYTIFKILSNTCNGFRVEYEGKPQPPRPPKINLEPIDGNAKKLFERLKKTYNDPTSNGVLISIIWYEDSLEKKVYLDGSGSIIRKDIYSKLISTGPGICDFGFIWDIDWLEPKEGEPLVDCLFPVDSNTVPFSTCRNIWIPDSDLDFCKIANTSEPDRCSTGLQNYFIGKIKNNPKNPDPTNCTQNIKYIYKNPYREILSNENCFKYIVDSNRIEGPDAAYNEAVFLKTLDESGIEINEGLEELTRLNKPRPVALVFVLHNMKCTHISQLKVLKINFAPKTVVIRINYESQTDQIEFVDHIRLDQIPGYNNL